MKRSLFCFLACISFALPLHTQATENQILIKRPIPYDTAIEMKIEAQPHTSSSQYYKMACLSLYSEDWDKAKISTYTPQHNESTITMGIYNLDSNTDYQCYIAFLDNKAIKAQTLTMALKTTTKRNPSPSIPITPQGTKGIPQAAQPQQDSQNANTEEVIFSDLSPNSLAGKAARNLYQQDVISGYADGTFRGNNPVNRAEAAKFLVNAVLGDHNNAPATPFIDIEESQWYGPYVATAYQQGWINGYADNQYRPANTINTAEFLKIIAEAFNLSSTQQLAYSDVSDTDWFAPYAKVAQQYNLMPLRGDIQLSPAQDMSRSEVAIAIDTILKIER